MYGYIYKGTNLINNKIYVGQHKSEKFDESYYGSGLLWKRACNKYGLENIKIEIIEICDDREQLNERKAYWIQKLQSQNKTIGYNISGSTTNPYAMSGCKNPMYGKHHSEETKQKIREKAVGRKVSEETRLKIQKSCKGKKVSEETKKKRSNSLKERKPSENTIQAVIKANSRPVAILDENFNIVKCFDKATDLPKFFGLKQYSIVMSRVLNSNCTKLYKGYYLIWLSD